MNYTRTQLAEWLQGQLTLGYDVKRIADHAHTLFLDNRSQMSTDLERVVMKIMMMEEGPQFELSETELRALVEELSRSSQ